MQSHSFLVAQLVKNPPTMQETWVQSLGWEDPLEEGMPTPAFWPGESLWREKPGGLQSMGSQRVGHNLATKCSNTHAENPFPVSPSPLVSESKPCTTISALHYCLSILFLLITHNTPNSASKLHKDKAEA